MAAAALQPSCVRVRAQYELVYTYVGDIVVSVNPFKNTGCYGKAIRAKFKGGSRRTLPPHIYALVDHAYQEMMRPAAGWKTRRRPCVSTWAHRPARAF